MTENNECQGFTKEVLEVFPNIRKAKIIAEYKYMTSKKLGYVTAKIPKKIDLDAESLLLGNPSTIIEKKLKPKKYDIFINSKLQNIRNHALRKEIVQNILIHELLHIENDDLFTLSKNYRKCKKKKIHVKDFEEEVFKRYNMIRESKGIMKIEKHEHLELAIHKILKSVNLGK